MNKLQKVQICIEKIIRKIENSLGKINHPKTIPHQIMQPNNKKIKSKFYFNEFTGRFHIN